MVAMSKTRWSGQSAPPGTLLLLQCRGAAAILGTRWGKQAAPPATPFLPQGREAAAMPRTRAPALTACHAFRPFESEARRQNLEPWGKTIETCSCAFGAAEAARTRWCRRAALRHEQARRMVHASAVAMSLRKTRQTILSLAPPCSLRQCLRKPRAVARARLRTCECG